MAINQNDRSSLNSRFRKGNEWGLIPFLQIPNLATDREEIYIPGKSRLDKISLDYYGSALFESLILQANPQYTIETDIDEEVVLRIPYPLETVLEIYGALISEYNTL